MDGMALCRHYNWSLKLLWLKLFHNHATFFISSSFLLHNTSKTNIWWVSCGIMRNTMQCTEMLLYSSISWCCYQLFCSCEKYVLYEKWQGNRCQFEKICEILGESNVRAFVIILCPISWLISPVPGFVFFSYLNCASLYSLDAVQAP